MSYCFQLFRKHDLIENGIVNKYWIEYAPREMVLRIIEVAFNFVLFMVILLNHSMKTLEEIRYATLINYWIMIDSTIILLYHPYILISKRILLHGEITKNIYTLFTVQKSKLNKRRIAGVSPDSDEFKTFFKADTSGGNFAQFKLQRKPTMTFAKGSIEQKQLLNKEKRKISKKLSQVIIGN